MLESQNLSLIGTFLVVAELLGIMLAFHAVMQPRSSQGAIAWFIALITVPVITIPLYTLFGRTRFLGYKEALREAEDCVGDRLQLWFEKMNTMAAPPQPGLKYLETLARRLTSIPFQRGNRVELLIDGAAPQLSALEHHARRRAAERGRERRLGR